MLFFLFWLQIKAIIPLYSGYLVEDLDLDQYKYLSVSASLCLDLVN